MSGLIRKTAAQEHGDRVRASGREYRGGYDRGSTPHRMPSQPAQEKVAWRWHKLRLSSATYRLARVEGKRSTDVGEVYQCPLFFSGWKARYVNPLSGTEYDLGKFRTLKAGKLAVEKRAGR